MQDIYRPTEVLKQIVDLIKLLTHFLEYYGNLALLRNKATHPGQSTTWFSKTYLIAPEGMVYKWCTFHGNYISLCRGVHYIIAIMCTLTG